MECLKLMTELENLGALRGELLGEITVLADDFVVTSFFVGKVIGIVVVVVDLVVAAMADFVVAVGCESGSWCGRRGGGVGGFGRGS